MKAASAFTSFETTAPGSTCSTRRGCSESSVGSTGKAISKARESASPSPIASWKGTVDESGPRRKWTAAPRSTSRSAEGRNRLLGLERSPQEPAVLFELRNDAGDQVDGVDVPGLLSEDAARAESGQ